MRFGIVVVHWRGMADTRECLESLARVEYGSVEVVAVANGPGDFDGDAARKACPDLAVIAAAENQGYAAGCNIGARALFDRGADAVLLLNNDTVVAPTIVEALAATFADTRTGIAGPIVSYYDDPRRAWFAGGYLNRVFGYTRHDGFGAPTGSLALGPARTTDFISGSALAVRRQAWDATGGVDERYFHYFEDVDLCERARASGWRSVLVPEALVRHKVSAAAGTRGSNRLNRDQTYYFARNRLLFVRRNLAGGRRITATIAQFALLLPYECLRAARRGNWPEILGRVEGVIDALRGRTGPRTKS